MAKRSSERDEPCRHRFTSERPTSERWVNDAEAQRLGRPKAGYIRQWVTVCTDRCGADLSAPAVR